jgi:hypothetical protein
MIHSFLFDQKQFLSYRYVHGVEKVVEDPIKIPTPYGGRLVWLLPGKNRLIVHMKDKNSIRHKKRWSQVRYKNPFSFFSNSLFFF